MAFGDLPHALALTAVSLDGSTVELQWPTADVLAFEPSAPHAGAHPFDDQRPFQFGDGGDDHDDGLAKRSTSVDIFFERDVFDFQPVQLVQHFKEVFHRPCDPIGSPDQDNIEVATASVSHYLAEARALGLHPADPIRVLLDDVKAALGRHLPQVEELCSPTWSTA
jgi:hypothetical protein